MASDTVILPRDACKALPEVERTFVPVETQTRGPANIVLCPEKLWSRPAAEIVAILQGEIEKPEGW